MEELKGERVVLAPTVAGDANELRRIVATPEVLDRWGPQEPAWPFDDEATETWTVWHDGRVAGLIQAGEESEPRYRHAWIDVFLDPVLCGAGLGTDAVYTLARHLVCDRGHHRLVIDPAADNARAIRCYEKVGFRPVGAMRSYERDVRGEGWHDGLLMDLVASELPERPPGS